MPTVGMDTWNQQVLLNSFCSSFANLTIGLNSVMHLVKIGNTSEALQAALGRNFHAQRFGPRPLDLDIIFYGNQQMQHDRLTIPHPRWKEREFVVAPLADLFRPEEDLQQGPWQGLARSLTDVRALWSFATGSHCTACLLLDR